MSRYWNAHSDLDYYGKGDEPSIDDEIDDDPYALPNPTPLKCEKCGHEHSPYSGMLLCERVLAHNGAVIAIVKFLDKNGHNELADQIASAFMDAAGE